jgi:hypothetical protein
MIKIIQSDKKLSDILINQMRIWWGQSLKEKLLDKLMEVYQNKLKDNQEFNLVVERVKELFKKSTRNQKDLSKLIDTYLIPQELEKKENAEVSTPLSLRKEMLDSIPKEFWETPKKVFEPCSGKGGFLIDIVDRFMDGLKSIKDRKKRYQKIVEDCLYFSDINPTNIYICKLLLDPEGKYKLNYHEGDTLKLDINVKWKLMCFDAVIGNPPYSTDPSKPNSKPLYNLFIEDFIDKTNYLLFVVPSRWFVGGKGLDKFREKMMKRKDIKLIVHNDNDKEWFGNNVDIKGGSNYFLKDKDYNGLCKFNGIDYNLSKYDSIIKPKYHKIIDKLIKYESINKLYKSAGYFGYRTNDSRLKESGKIKCYVSSLKIKSRIKYLDKYEFNKENTFWKVITMEAAFGSGSGFGYKCIAKPDEIYTDSYISFKVNDEKEAKSLLSYLECKLSNYMLSIRKMSQHITENMIKWVPLVPLDRIWDDKQVYEYFKIDESELI